MAVQPIVVEVRGYLSMDLLQLLRRAEQALERAGSPQIARALHDAVWHSDRDLPLEDAYKVIRDHGVTLV